jgi:molybdopterin converting factor small subunit
MAEVHPTYNMAQIIGKNKIITEAPDIATLLQDLEKDYGKEMTDRLKQVTILINGISISYLKGKKTKLKPTDEIHLINPAGGG